PCPDRCPWRRSANRPTRAASAAPVGHRRRVSTRRPCASPSLGRTPWPGQRRRPELSLPQASCPWICSFPTRRPAVPKALLHSLARPAAVGGTFGNLRCSCVAVPAALRCLRRLHRVHRRRHHAHACTDMHDDVPAQPAGSGLLTTRGGQILP